MNGQYFKEVLETVCKTTGRTKLSISEHLGVSTTTLFAYQNKGVPVRLKPYVMSVLKEVLFEG